MSELAIEQLNKISLEKQIFCELNDYLFDGDLMGSETGKIWRKNITLEQLV